MWQKQIILSFWFDAALSRLWVSYRIFFVIRTYRFWFDFYLVICFFVSQYTVGYITVWCVIVRWFIVVAYANVTKTLENVGKLFFSTIKGFYTLFLWFFWWPLLFFWFLLLLWPYYLLWFLDRFFLLRNLINIYTKRVLFYNFGLLYLLLSGALFGVTICFD